MWTRIWCAEASSNRWMVTSPRPSDSSAFRTRPRSGSDLNLRVSWVPPAKSTPSLRPGPKKINPIATRFRTVDAMIQCQRYSMKRILVLWKKRIASP